MLKNVEFGWVGKLPINADFIQSKHHVEFEKSLLKWMVEGQDHIGEQMFKSSQPQRYMYYFTIPNMHVHGLILLSEDQRHRQCPFIIYAKKISSPSEILGHLKLCFESLNFEINSLIWNITNNELFDVLDNNLRKIAEFLPASQNQQWIELYPQPMDLNLSVESLTPILYRKLIHRQV